MLLHGLSVCLFFNRAILSQCNYSYLKRRPYSCPRRNILYQEGRWAGVKVNNTYLYVPCRSHLPTFREEKKKKSQNSHPQRGFNLLIKEN